MSATPSAAPVGWQYVGEYTVHNGVPVRPNVPLLVEKPGVYRLTFANGFVYIGQTVDIARRLREYVKPSQGTEQEYVMRHILLDAGSATIDVITAAEFEIEDKKEKQKRLTKREEEELEDAIERGDLVLNT